MLSEILIIFIVLWLLILKWRRRKLVELAKQLKPRNIALPFVGHSYLFFGNDEDRMKALQKLGEEALQRDGLISHWQGNQLYVLVADPAIAEIVLKNCLEKDDVTRLLRQIIGNGSIFAPVSVWRPRRKILAPTFSAKNLYHFAEIFSRQSNIMVSQLRRTIGDTRFSIWRYLSSYAMDSVCETTLGVTVGAQKQPDQPFIFAFEECCRIDAARICQPWLYNDTLYKMLPCYREHTKHKKFILNFVDEIIKNKSHSMKTRLTTQSAASDKHGGLKTFLELLIEASRDDKGYNHSELLEETLVIVLAGTDTSAVGMSFTAVMLSKHPEVQEKIYQELHEVFGDSDRPVTAEDLPRLKYLEAAIKETLRLYPPVPFIVRKVEKDLPLPSGITLVEGCGVFISIWSVHRNPQYWGEDASLYRPERFVDSTLKHPAAFMPFSHGPRSCLGYQYAMMSMKTALASLLRQYQILPEEHQPNRDSCEMSSENLRVKFDIMMRHVDNFVIKLEPRN